LYCWHLSFGDPTILDSTAITKDEYHLGADDQQSKWSNNEEQTQVASQTRATATIALPTPMFETPRPPRDTEPTLKQLEDMTGQVRLLPSEEMCPIQPSLN